MPVKPPIVAPRPVAPQILIPKKFDPRGAVGMSPPGALTNFGNEDEAAKILMHFSGRPELATEGWAELAADNGLIHYRGNSQYEDLDGKPIRPEEVFPRFEKKLREIAGNRRLASTHKIRTSFAGQIPEGMKDMKKFLGLTKEIVSKTSFAASYGLILRDAPDDALYMFYAGARMLINSGYCLEEVFRNPEMLGIATGRGLPGVKPFVDLTEAALKGQSIIINQKLPNSLQSAAMGGWVAMIGPKGEELPEDLGPDKGFRAMGDNLQGSWECATFYGLICWAAKNIGPPRRKGETAIMGMQIGTGESPHGREDARICAVGFNSLKAMDTDERLGDRANDLWQAYGPFTDASVGFVPGSAAGFISLYDFLYGFKHGLPMPALLEGYAVRPDQGGKTNHAQLGRGIVNAMRASLRIAIKGRDIRPEDIDLVSFHGTGTNETNTNEPFLLAKVLQGFGFERRKKRIKATALKAILTHGLGAAGGQELAMILQILRYQRGPGILNLKNGRQIIVPPDVQEWIDFSDEPIEGEINVVMALSEGFSGNNTSIIVQRLTDELLLRFRGITQNDVRIYRERVAERLEVSRRLNELVRTGQMTYAEVLDWASFKDRDTLIPSPKFKLGWRRSLEKETPLSEGAEKVRNTLNRFAFTASRWSTFVVYQMRQVLAAESEKDYAVELERLDDLLMRLRAGDPSAFFAMGGLPHVMEVVTSNPKALDMLARSAAFQRALLKFSEPEKIRPANPPTIPTNAEIPFSERRVVIGAPGQGAFDEKRCQMAKNLYESHPSYRAALDEAHERLFSKYGYDLKQMLFHGAKDDLLQTRHQQPVLVADELGRSVMAMERLEAAGVPIQAAFGDSVGLIPAAFIAGYFQSVGDAVEFAYLRADVMGNLNPFGPEARPMGIALGSEEEQVREVVDEVDEVFGIHVTVTKRNGVGKLVVSGEPSGIDLINERMAQREGNFQKIGVSSPFHDPHYFAPAATELLQRARQAGLTGARRSRRIALIGNSNGQVVPDDVDILEFLADEIAKNVDLVASMQTGASLGGNVFVEVGPKSTLTNDVATALAAMENPPDQILAVFVSKPEDLNKVTSAGEEKGD